MKRYMVLAGESYYPSGFDDYLGMYVTLEEAHEAGKTAVTKKGWFVEEEKVVYPVKDSYV